MPRLHEVDGEWRLLLGESRAVEADAGAGVLRRQADDHSPAHAVSDHGANGVCDVRVPVAHADVDAEPEFVGEKFALFLREFGQRRSSDQPVAMLDFFDHIRRKGTASGYTQQKFWDLIDGLGAAVGQE